MLPLFLQLLFIETSAAAEEEEEIRPLLSLPERPRKINIFTLSYPTRKPRVQLTSLVEAEISPITQFVQWVWSGSRYSGLLCMALSSTIYFLMGLVSDIFSVQRIPLFEIAFIRCTVVLISSYVWLRRSGQSISGQTNVKFLLISRALTGYISFMSFIYCIQRLPLSQAVVITSTTPIMASVMARIILHEKLRIADIGGLACSFFGVLFTFRQVLNTQGGLVNNSKEEGRNVHITGSNHIFAILVGLFSSLTGGISYCLIKAGAKASDLPVATVFSFGLLSRPAELNCHSICHDTDNWVLLKKYSKKFVLAGVKLRKNALDEWEDFASKLGDAEALSRIEKLRLALVKD